MKPALLVCSLAALAGAGPLYPQANCTSTPAPCSTPVGALQVSITIGSTFELLLSPTSTTLTTPGTAEYNAGFAANDGPVATIKSNAPWALLISALNPTWSATNTEAEPARTNKPATDLTWSTSPTGVFTELSTLPVQVRTGTASMASNVAIFYRTKYAWSLDTPGVYSLQIVFTVAAP